MDPHDWKIDWATLIKASAATFGLKAGTLVRFKDEIAEVKTSMYLKLDGSLKINIELLECGTNLSVSPYELRPIDHLSALAEQL